jgi:hypothetical protein
VTVPPVAELKFGVVIVAEITDGPEPIEFNAVTVNVYAVAAVNPVIEAVVPVTTIVPSTGEPVTVYEEIALSPTLSGADQERLIAVLRVADPVKD